MLHPSNEITDLPAALPESAAGISYRVFDSSEQCANAAVPPLHEEKPTSPICAACWAY